MYMLVVGAALGLVERALLHVPTSGLSQIGHERTSVEGQR